MGVLEIADDDIPAWVHDMEAAMLVAPSERVGGQPADNLAGLPMIANEVTVNDGFVMGDAVSKDPYISETIIDLFPLEWDVRIKDAAKMRSPEPVRLLPEKGGPEPECQFGDDLAVGPIPANLLARLLNLAALIWSENIMGIMKPVSAEIGFHFLVHGIA